MRKEKSSVVVLGIILGLAINFLVFMGMTAYCVGSTVYSVDYYKKIFTSDGVIDEFYKYAEDEFEDSLEDSSLAGYDIEYDDLFSRDFMKRFIDDFVEGMLAGKKDVFDDDYYEDYILDEVVPEIEDQTGQRLSVAEQEDLVEDFINDMNDTVRDSNKDLKDNAIYENLDKSDSIKIGSIVFLVIAAILSVVMVTIHKNKYRGMRKVCVAVFIASLVDWMAWIGIRESFKEFVEEEYSKRGADKRMKPIMESLADVYLKDPMIVTGVITLIALAGIVIFAILSKRKGKSDEDDVEEAYRYNNSEYYAHTVAPMQQQGYNQPYGQQPFTAQNNPYANPYANNQYDPNMGQPAANPYQQGQFNPNNYTANAYPQQNPYTPPTDEKQVSFLSKLTGLPPEDDGMSGDD